MYTKKSLFIAMGIFLSFGLVAGFITANNLSSVSAQEDAAKVNDSTLEQLYMAAFGRPVDEGGRKFHVGRDLKDVLRDINNSAERRYYSALFKAVKAYEEALRAPGNMNSDDKQKYLDNIDSALATLLAWVETLPEQNICDAVVGIVQARQAIQDAYDSMNPVAKAAAEKGIFKALSNLGRPKDLPLPARRCLTTPSPSVTSAPTPSLTPTSSPTESSTSTQTPSPSPTPNE
ncbi:MAG: hypothetical protein Q7S32_02095 [bacterium]|nr:hypothetical protein [bacterium]